MDLLKIQRKYLTPNGTELMIESKAHIKYIAHMEGIHSALPNNCYKINMDGAVPSDKIFLSQFVELYDANNNLRDSLVVYMKKTAVCNLTSSHNNPIMEENVT